ncbi:MAG: ECF-type sigma factor [Acidobacteriota bacterium]
MSKRPYQDLTQALEGLSDRESRELQEYLPVVYDELRRLARLHLRRERKGHTLQTTALVHEAYLKLAAQRNMKWRGRGHFFAVASLLMRRILVDYARRREAARRGGGAERVTLDASMLASRQASVDLIALDEALDRLAEIDQRQSRIVEMHFFGGLTFDEIAEVLRIASSTARDDWTVARAWLYDQLRRR